MSNIVSKKRLGDVVNFKRGYDLPSYNRIEGQYPIVSSSGISGYHAEYKVEGEGLVTGRYGTLGEVYYINGKYWPHNTALYVTDFKGNYPKYVYYLMKCLGNLKTSDKSTVPGINRNDLHEIVIPYIEPKYQQRIAAILSALDAKIELNQRINAELESMAKTLYDYWFVQFDFPNEKGKPYKSAGGKVVWNEELKREIPLGWKVESIETCCEIIDCLHSKKPDYEFENERYYLLQLENIRDDGLLDLTNKYFVPKNVYKTWTSRIEVTEDDILITNAGRVAATAQVPNGIKSGIGRNITAIRPKSVSPTYLFLAFRGIDIRRQIKWNTDSGAFFSSFNVKGIKKLFILRPKADIEKQFEKTVKVIRRKRELSNIESQMLTELRDWLLPMLMNGQVVVK
ncbi:MAG: restriction endonuclease subunit S [Anaerolineales bacterium]|nr:restriction endonuclease subunit S [Anaerolineales bacterium]